MSGDQLDTHVLTHSFPTRRSSDLTEISRRLAKLAHAPSIKVEATKFTEVGYVGRDVEQIVRDLVESAIVMVRAKKREEMRAQAHHARSEEHTSELQSLMRISYAVFCLKQKTKSQHSPAT